MRILTSELNIPGTTHVFTRAPTQPDVVQTCDVRFKVSDIPLSTPIPGPSTLDALGQIEDEYLIAWTPGTFARP